MWPAEMPHEPHFDGGASVIAAVLTLYGVRGVNFQFDGKWLSQAVRQAPGSFYVGTLASVWHVVEHYHDAGSLYHDAVDDAGCKIVIIFRSECFAANRGRTMGSKPGPGLVFDIVNTIVARKLATEPLLLPSAAEAMEGVLRACGQGLFEEEGSLPVESLGKRRRLKGKTSLTNMS